MRGRQGAAVILSVLPFMHNRGKVDSLIFPKRRFWVVKKQISAVLVNREIKSETRRALGNCLKLRIERLLRFCPTYVLAKGSKDSTSDKTRKPIFSF